MSPAMAWFRRALFAGTCGLGVAAVSAQVPSSDAFRINAHSAGAQWRPAVAADPLGRFLVVWRSDGQDGDGPGVFGRHFDASGTPGPELALDTHGVGSQFEPVVAASGDGRFFVVWSGIGPGDVNRGIFGRRVDAHGIPQGQTFLINTETRPQQNRPAVDMAADGGAVVAWRSGAQVKARRFDSTGIAVGAEFLVATTSTDSLSWAPAVALVGSNGAFVIAWSDGSQHVDARRYAADGTPLGPSFTVAAMDPDGFLVATPQVASDGQGRTLVTWGVVNAFEHVVTSGRWIDSAGTLGPVVELVPFAANTPSAGRLSMIPSGDFVVTWDQYSTNYYGWALMSSRFDSDATAQGDVTLAPDGRDPVVAHRGRSDARDFVVVWYETHGDFNVWGRTFRAPPQFEDGFESGDTSAWSATVP